MITRLETVSSPVIISAGFDHKRFGDYESKNQPKTGRKLAKKEPKSVQVVAWTDFGTWTPSKSVSANQSARFLKVTESDFSRLELQVDE